MSQTCRHVLSAYDHWHCQRGRFHFGKHRFNNYVGAWFPHFWKIGDLLKIRRCNERLSVTFRSVEKKPTPMSYRKALYPVAYRPVPAEPALNEPFLTAW